MPAARCGRCPLSHLVSLPCFKERCIYGVNSNEYTESLTYLKHLFLFNLCQAVFLNSCTRLVAGRWKWVASGGFRKGIQCENPAYGTKGIYIQKP